MINKAQSNVCRYINNNTPIEGKHYIKLVQGKRIIGTLVRCKENNKAYKSMTAAAKDLGISVYAVESNIHNNVKSEYNFEIVLLRS